LSGGRDGTVRVWDVGTRKAVGVVREGGAVWAVGWRPTGGDVVGGGDVGMGDSGSGSSGGGIGGSGAMGFVTGGEEGVVRWYRGAGMV
jgi:WD repeat-containing protein 61